MNTAAIPRILLVKMLVKNKRNSFSCHKTTLCIVKAEKVVNAPKKPIKKPTKRESIQFTDKVQNENKLLLKLSINRDIK